MVGVNRLAGPSLAKWSANSQCSSAGKFLKIAPEICPSLINALNFTDSPGSHENGFALSRLNCECPQTHAMIFRVFFAN
jgi:hypothetical protein